MIRLIFLALTLSLYMGGNSFAQSEEEIEFVIEFFDELQPISIADNREYCGYFGIDENGQFVATKPNKGREDSCLADEPPPNMEIFASYHTHGAFSVDADSETPSSGDLEADISEEIDGYIATPGGRIWFIDSLEGAAMLICGRNCTVSDDRYEDGIYPEIKDYYSLEELYERDEMVE